MSFQLPGFGKIAQPYVPAGPGPSIGLVIPLDHPLNVQSPHGLAGLEAQGFKGDFDFSNPTITCDAGMRIPDPVPIQACKLGAVGNLSVRARPIGIDVKEETIAVIEERIDHNGNIVIHIQLRIACELSGDDGRGRTVETGYAEE